MRQSKTNRTILIGVLCAILALLVGGCVGLLLSRGLGVPGDSPDSFASLGVHTKEEYIILVAGAYCADQDLEKAQAQLDLLEAPNINQWIMSLIDRALAEEWDEKDVQVLLELAYGLGIESPEVMAYMATLTPPPTNTPLPSPTPAPTDTPTSVPVAPTDQPTAVPPSDTPQPQPTDTLAPPSSPTPAPMDTPVPPTATTAPSDTPVPQPTSTTKPQPTPTVAPTSPPAAKWTYTARLEGPGPELQHCARQQYKLIRVTIMNAAGNQIPGVWIYEKFTNQYEVSGHKGEDPFWGPGEVELIGLDGGQICIATGQGGSCESDFTRSLPTHDPPPFEDLWAAGYCECCESGISKDRCQELYDSGECLGISWYAWHVEFSRSN